MGRFKRERTEKEVSSKKDFKVKAALPETGSTRRGFLGQVGRWSAALGLFGLVGETWLQASFKRSMMANAMAGGGSEGLSPATLLFASNFEGDVQFGRLQCGSTSCFQFMEGFDPTTGFDWADFNVLGGIQRGHLITGVSGTNSGNIGEYHDNQVLATIGPHGTPTRAARFRVLQNTAGANQNVWGYTSVRDMPEQLYFRYWLRLEDDFVERMGPNSWMSFWGWKTSGDDYRLSCQVIFDSNGVPFWYIRGDSPASGERFFAQRNRSVPVPYGEWMKVECFYTREGRGRIWWAVNGLVLFDYVPPEGHDLYGAERRRIRGGAFHSVRAAVPTTREVWLDEFEVWDNFPADSAIGVVPPQSPSGIQIIESRRFKDTA